MTTFHVPVATGIRTEEPAADSVSPLVVILRVVAGFLACFGLVVAGLFSWISSQDLAALCGVAFLLSLFAFALASIVQSLQTICHRLGVQR
jgi:uncharacterized membrane protein YcfT